MRYGIVLAPEAIADFKRLRAAKRAMVRDALEAHLRFDPARTSKSRIKRLRGRSKPQFRLRVDDLRIFYDVSGRKVEVLAIVLKAQAEAWLKKVSESS